MEAVIQTDNCTGYLPEIVVANLGPSAIKAWAKLWKQYLLNNHKKLA
jgi:hypothetical protein